MVKASWKYTKKAPFNLLGMCEKKVYNIDKKVFTFLVKRNMVIMSEIMYDRTIKRTELQ